MKEIREEIKREVTDTHISYEAIDGTKFTNKEECIKYEDTVFCVLMARAKTFALPIEDSQCTNPFDYSDENEYITLCPQKPEHIDVMNQLNRLNSPLCQDSMFSDDCIGNLYLMGYRTYSNSLDALWFHDMQKSIDVMTGGKYELKPKA